MFNSQKRRKIRALSAVLAALLVLMLAGCAAAPPKSEDGSADPEPVYEVRSVSQKNGFTLTEESKIDSEVESEFEAAMKALNEGETEKGVALLEKVTKASPKATAPYINLAIAYSKLNKLGPAEEALKTALKLNPDHPVANNELGMLYRKTGRFNDAKTVYEKIVEKYADFQPARKNLGVLCDLYLRDPECALANYKIYSAAVPDDKQVAIWIADLQTRLGKQ